MGSLYIGGDLVAPSIVVSTDSTTPTGNIDITSTDVYDVSKYATAQVKDANLKAENIKKDVKILGITGTAEGSGTTVLNTYGLLKNGTTIDLSNDTEIRPYAFYGAEGNIQCKNAENIGLIGNCAFCNSTAQGINFGPSFAMSNVPNVILLKTLTTNSTEGINNIPVKMAYITTDIEIFKGCNNLTALMLPLLEPYENNISETYDDTDYTSSPFYSLFGGTDETIIPASLKRILLYGVITQIDTDSVSLHQFYGDNANYLQYIPAYMFKNCKNIETIEFGAMTRADVAISIRQSCFFGCTALIKVTNTDKTYDIGETAFYGCTSLKTIDLGTNLRKIEGGAFVDSGITNINYSGTKAQWKAINKDNQWASGMSFTITCTDGTITVSNGVEG